MSTDYQFTCDDCKESGGFFSEQAWGWGNCDIFTNFKFLVAHVLCAGYRVISEHEEIYGDGPREEKFHRRLCTDQYLREDVWPRANEWEWARAGDSAKCRDEWLKHEGLDAPRPKAPEAIVAAAK